LIDAAGGCAATFTGDESATFAGTTTLVDHHESPNLIEGSLAILADACEELGVRALRMVFAPHVRWGGPNSKLEGFIADFDGTSDSRYWLERNARVDGDAGHRRRA